MLFDNKKLVLGGFMAAAGITIAIILAVPTIISSPQQTTQIGALPVTYKIEPTEQQVGVESSSVQSLSTEIDPSYDDFTMLASDSNFLVPLTKNAYAFGQDDIHVSSYEWSMSTDVYGLDQDASNIYFTEPSNNKVGAFLGGTLKEWPLPNPSSEPYDIIVQVAGQAQYAYFTEKAGRIGYLDLNTNVITEWSLPTTGATADRIIDSFSLSWPTFSEVSHNKIGQLQGNTIVEWTIPGSTIDEKIAADSEGYIWYTKPSDNIVGRLNLLSNSITEWAVPTADSGVSAISVYGGPNNPNCPMCGYVVFAETDSNKLGRLYPVTNTITEWTIPTADSRPTDVKVLGDRFYFVENSANKIGRLNPYTTVFTEWEIPTSDSDTRNLFGDGGISNSRLYFVEVGTQTIGLIT